MSDNEHTSKRRPPKFSTANRIFRLCGSQRAAAKAAGVTSSYACRWNWPPEQGGADGMVPLRSQRAILAASARGETKTPIAPEDFAPTPNLTEEIENG